MDNEFNTAFSGFGQVLHSGIPRAPLRLSMEVIMIAWGVSCIEFAPRSTWGYHRLETQLFRSSPGLRACPPSAPIVHLVSFLTWMWSSIFMRCLGAILFLLFLLVFYAFALWDRWLSLRLRTEENRRLQGTLAVLQKYLKPMFQPRSTWQCEKLWVGCWGIENVGQSDSHRLHPFVLKGENNNPTVLTIQCFYAAVTHQLTNLSEVLLPSSPSPHSESPPVSSVENNANDSTAISMWRGHSSVMLETSLNTVYHHNNNSFPPS